MDDHRGIHQAALSGQYRESELDGDVRAIRLELRVNQRTLAAELAAHEEQGTADLLHRDAMDAAHRRENEGFGQVREGEERGSPRAYGEERAVIPIADRPEAQRRGRKPNDLGRARDCVRGELLQWSGA